MRDNDGMKTQKLSVTVPENIVDQVRRKAEEDHRSFSKMLSLLLAEALKNKAT